MLQCALTGGIGSGKSTVAQVLRECGAIIIDSDVLAREVVAPHTPGWHQVVDHFGSDVLNLDSTLNRGVLADLVFRHPAQRAALNAIVHPLVRAAAQDVVARCSPHDIVVHDIPLLTETHRAHTFAFVLVVHSSVKTRTERLIRTRGMTLEQINARFAAQADDPERLSIADAVIDNDGSLGTTTEDVQRLWRERILPMAQRMAMHDPVPVDLCSDLAAPSTRERDLAQARLTSDLPPWSIHPSTLHETAPRILTVRAEEPPPSEVIAVWQERGFAQLQRVSESLLDRQEFAENFRGDFLSAVGSCDIRRPTCLFVYRTIT